MRDRIAKSNAGPAGEDRRGVADVAKEETLAYEVWHRNPNPRILIGALFRFTGRSGFCLFLISYGWLEMSRRREAKIGNGKLFS